MNADEIRETLAAASARAASKAQMIDLPALRAEALILPDLIDHHGDCASSLCGACGHCLHSITDCGCPSCGCHDYIETDEVAFRRKVVALIDFLSSAPGRTSSGGVA